MTIPATILNLAENVCRYFGMGNRPICPSCGGEATASGFSFSCKNPECDFFYASVLDLAELVGGGIDSLSFAAGLKKGEIEMQAPELFEALQASVKLRKAFRELVFHESPSSAGRHAIEQSGFEKAIWFSATASSGAVRKLLELLKTLGAAPVKCAADKGGAVVPLWLRPGIMTGLAFFNNSRGPISSHRISAEIAWAGSILAPIPTLVSGIREAGVAISLGQEAITMLDGLPGWAPPEMRMSSLNQAVDFRNLTRIRQLGTTFQINVPEALAAAIRSGSISHQMAVRCNLRPNEIAQTIAILSTSTPQEAAKLEEAAATAPVYTSDFGNLYSSPAGFRAETSSGRACRLSNFSVVPEKTVRFGTEPESCKVFRVSCGSHSWEVVSSSVQAATGKSAAKTLEGPPGSPELIIVEPGLYTRLVGPYIRSAGINLPEVEGAPGLGWHGGVFYGAGWKVSSSGISTGIVLKPGSAEQALFEKRPDIRTDFESAEGLGNGALDLIAACCGMVVRSFLGMPCRPIVVCARGLPRKAAEELFAGIGQSRAAKFDFRGKTDFDIYNGHPVYGVGYNEAQARRSLLPAVILSDMGWMPGDLGDINRAAAVFAGALAYAARSAIDGKARQPSSRASWEAALIADGSGALAGYPGWNLPADSYDAFERMLAAGGFDIFYNMEAQEIIMEIPEHLDALEVSLGASASGIKNRLEGRRLIVEALSGMEALQAFYGSVPKMVRVEQTANAASM